MAKRKALSQGRRLGLVRATGLELEPPPTAAALPEELFEPKAVAQREADGCFSFTFLNHREDFTLPFDWHRPSLQTGTRLWLLNLHYMQYLRSLSDGDFQALVRDWISSTPPYRPYYWTFDWNSYSLSIRVVALMSDAGRRQARLPPDFVRLLDRSIANQLHFLERNLETDIGGNHIVKNIKALIWGSAYFEGPAAARWRALALKLLERELQIQILPDGMHYERSPSYHAQVFADLLEIRAVLGPNVLDGALDDVLRRMAEPLADLTHPDGRPALFNDAGLAMAEPPGSALAAYRELSNCDTARRSVFAYPNAGYYGRYDNSWYLVADFGPVGPDDLPAHAHGDIGSFELSAAGQRLIVDPGVYEYNPGERRARSRSAASHNVLHIDGGDQAEFFGSFRCGRRPTVTSSFEATGSGFELIGTHDGYASRSGGLVHHRLRTDRRSLRIDDRIEGGGTANASFGLLLHPEATPVRSGNSIAVERERARIVVHADIPLGIEEALYWPDMGVEQPTRRLVASLPQGAGGLRIEIEIDEP
jgi:uncharacterized heparinase superfamily protein